MLLALVQDHRLPIAQYGRMPAAQFRLQLHFVDADTQADVVLPDFSIGQGQIIIRAAPDRDYRLGRFEDDPGMGPRDDLDPEKQHDRILAASGLVKLPDFARRA